MSPQLEDWLDRWSALLDRILASGVSNLTPTTRGDLEVFRVDAEDLGWSAVASRISLLTDPDQAAETKAEALLDLASLHAIACRLQLADELSE